MSSLQKLCRELEAAVGKPLKTSRDFNQLALMITERTRQPNFANHAQTLVGVS